MRSRGSPQPQERASDAERERAVRTLREGSAEGRLSHGTFVGRLDRALRARSRAELSDLLSDVQPRGSLASRVVEAVAALSAFTARVEAAWRMPRLPGLVLPEVSTNRLMIGRAPSCDLVLSDPTVSRFHALLRRRRGEWLLVDLDSKNGTYLNGWRLSAPLIVRPGDRVAFGKLDFRVSGPRSFEAPERKAWNEPG